MAGIGGPGSASLATQYMLRPLTWFLVDIATVGHLRAYMASGRHCDV